MNQVAGNQDQMRMQRIILSQQPLVKWLERPCKAQVGQQIRMRRRQHGSQWKVLFLKKYLSQNYAPVRVAPGVNSLVLFYPSLIACDHFSILTPLACLPNLATQRTIWLGF
jgi:hypothetical protein